MTGTAGKLNYDAYRAANDATVRQALRDQLAEEYNEMLSAQYTDEIRASYEEGTENYNTLMAQAEEAALGFARHRAQAHAAHRADGAVPARNWARRDPTKKSRRRSTSCSTTRHICASR